MKIALYPKKLLETMWKEDQALFAPDAKEAPLCLRCGQPLNERLGINPLSRYADTHICETCGVDEAMRDAFGEPLPLTEWAGLSDPRLQNLMKEEKIVLLTPVCSFRSIFQDIKKIPGYSFGHPVSEMVYSRSDFFIQFVSYNIHKLSMIQTTSSHFSQQYLQIGLDKLYVFGKVR